MPATVGAILNQRVRTLIRDKDVIQFSAEELIEWFNEACGEIARYRPEASSRTVDIDTVAGSLQRIPVDGLMLLEVLCNKGSSGVGRTVTRIERNDLDSEIPNWRFENPTVVAKRYVASLADPRTFMTYPASLGSASNGVAGLTIVYSSEPALVTADSDMSPLPSTYDAVIANYVLHRALSKQIENDIAQSLSAKYFNMFEKQLGITERSMEQRNSKSRQPVAK